MGQKVNPIGLRLGVNKTWSAKWFVDPKEYADTLHEDLKLRKALMARPEAQTADISQIEIIRQPQRVTMMIHTARPGVIIGQKGSTIEKISTELQKLTDKKIQVKIKEIKKPEVDAQIIALNIARQLKGRTSFRRAMRMTLGNAIKAGVQGIKIKIGGRIGGAEMARSIQVKEGSVPLHTLRANIDYGFAEADTTYGKLGVKVWINNGEIYGMEKKEDAGLLVKKSKPGTRS